MKQGGRVPVAKIAPDGQCPVGIVVEGAIDKAYCGGPLGEDVIEFPEDLVQVLVKQAFLRR